MDSIEKGVILLMILVIILTLFGLFIMSNLINVTQIACENEYGENVKVDKIGFGYVECKKVEKEEKLPRLTYMEEEKCQK